ncbi:MAG: acyl-CoA dehydrogenase family protein [Kineosporiaceae bacterium]|nr:acyl-CoA dehydrogenase family protein [Kineosporiaceae bacterium]
MTTSVSVESSFELSRDHEDFRRVVRDFAAEHVAPHSAAWDAAARFPVELVPRMGELGLFGLIVPEEYGGSGGDFTSLCVAIEELGRVDQSVGITLSAGVGLGITPLLTYGTAEQKARWLPDLVAGRALAAFGLTEPEAGSDAGATRTRAVLDEASREWVIDGAKAFITNSGTSITSVITITAVTGRRPDDSPELSTILVPAGSAGLVVDPPYRKLGWHASDTHGLTFAGCRVPEANLLGQRGAGLRQFLATLDDGRIAISALALGLARACLEACVEYAGSRVAFGRPIGANQSIAFAIADLAVAVDSARLLTYRAAALKDRLRAGDGSVDRAQVAAAAARAKLHTSTTAMDAARLATQVHGGSGFIEEYPVARYYRDAKILEIGEGTSEIQRLVIARGLGLPVD